MTENREVSPRLSATEWPEVIAQGGYWPNAHKHDEDLDYVKAPLKVEYDLVDKAIQVTLADDDHWGLVVIPIDAICELLALAHAAEAGDES